MVDKSMPIDAKFFINKVIEENDVNAFKRHNIQENDFVDKEDREVYNYIVEYARLNDGNAPSYVNVSARFDHFQYIPDITESFAWLAKKIKDVKGKEMVLDLFRTGKFSDQLTNLEAKEFLNWLQKQTEQIEGEIDLREKVGKSIKKDGDIYLQEYSDIKEGKSQRMFPSAFSSIGNYDTGNVYVLYGKSGRGKSVIALRDAVEVAMAGHTVLYWGMELNWYEIMSRLYAITAGYGELISSRTAGAHRMYADENGIIKGGFDPQDLQRAKLDGTLEEVLKEFLKNINEIMPGDIIIRAVDDKEFTGRSVDDLVADIKATDADFVIVDPFYYMDYEKNVSKKTGGDAEETSKKLKRMTGIEDVAVLALTQAEENDNEDTPDGNRELELPRRNEVKKSSALLEDASLLIAIDTDYREGAGIVGINKGRGGGEGNVSNIIFLPQYGVVKEIETGAGALTGFDKV